jgi:ribosomal protein S25
MKILILIAALGLPIFLTVFIVYAIKAHYKNIYEQTKHKASDADIFKIMARSNHFITEEQLAAATDLTKKEAANRLAHLSMEGALRRYHDTSGSMKGVYQLIEGIPLFDSLPAELDGLSEDEIISVILLHVDDYQVTIAELVVIFGINIAAAKVLLARLKKADKLNTLYNQSFQQIYVINKSLHTPQPVLRLVPRKKDRAQLAIPEQRKLKIPDSEVLQLAIEYDGRLTPTLLCIKLQVSMDEAKLKLEHLHEQGVFEMRIDEENALLEYQIRDRTLLG